MFNQLLENNQKGFRYSNYNEMVKKDPYFKKGLEDFKNGKVNLPEAVGSLYWVKKLVTQRFWDNWYRYHSSYCNLGKEGGVKDESGGLRGGKVKMGFLVVGSIPKDCMELNDEELRMVDEYRRANNVYPTPFKGVVMSQ